MLDEPGEVEAGQGDLEREGVGAAAVDGEDRDRAVVGAYGGGVQQVGLAVLPRPVRRRVHADVEDLAAAVPGGLGEGEERRLPPGRAARLGHDRRDDVDELRQAGDRDAVGVPEQGDEERPEDDGVGDAVVVLQEAGGLGPVVLLEGLRVRLPLGQVPDVPLVEGQVDLLLRLQAGAHVVGGRDDVVDERLHVDGGGEEGVDVPVLGPVVGVQRDVVDEVVGLLEDRRLPLGEGRHGLAGGTAGDEFDAGVQLAHGPGRLGGDAAVFLGGLVAGLPGAVHLVAEAPESDAEGVLVAVGDAEVGEGGASRVIGVLLEFEGLGDAAGAEVDGHHGFGLGADLAEEVDVLGEAEAVRLGGVPGEVETAGAAVRRAHGVFPLVARDEVAAGVADGGDAQFADEAEDVLAESLVVGCGVVGFEDAGVDAAAEVFHEAAEEAGVHFADGECRVEGEAGGVHGRLSGWVVLCGGGCGWFVALSLRSSHSLPRLSTFGIPKGARHFERDRKFGALARQWVTRNFEHVFWAEAIVPR